MPDRILIVEDDEGMRFFLREALRREGLEVEEAPDAETALEKLNRSEFDLVILDVKLPGMSGIEAIPRIKEIDPDAVIIIITAYGTKELALEAIKNGAYDYFSKPFELDEMNVVVKRALEKRHLQRELRELRERLIGRGSFGELIGASEAMQEVYGMIEKVAPTDATVLILGESGTGKEVVADEIHRRSPRAGGPMVKINCAAIPETLIESELFGHEKGAFTGATSGKPGKFELADGGTIFLDEVAELSQAAQAKLLRVLEGKEFEKVGGTKPIKVDVRVIAATNRDLEEEVREGRFREDLYYRLSVFTIHLPPLRERREDIPLLVDHFVRRAGLKYGKPVRGVSRDALKLLMDYSWPGNVRQLQHCIERAVVMAEGELITVDDLPPYLREAPRRRPIELSEEGFSLDGYLERVERELIEEALKKTGGVQAKAAKLLGISERSLWYRVKKLGIDVKRGG